MRTFLSFAKMHLKRFFMRKSKAGPKISLYFNKGIQNASVHASLMTVK